MDTGRISLEDIAKKYGTLKVQHGYMPIYERMFSFFRDQPVSLLEIGVHEGASLKTWNEYFVSQQTRILGIDKVITEKAKILMGPIYLEECDASKDFHLLAGEYDIIIDDGSHIAKEQLDSFYGLWEFLKPGGLYVVEDLFTLFDPIWNPSGPTILDEIEDRMGGILVGGDDIQEVHFFGRNDINGILFLRKRYEPFRIQPLSEFQ